MKLNDDFTNPIEFDDSDTQSLTAFVNAVRISQNGLSDDAAFLLRVKWLFKEFAKEAESYQ